MSFYYNLLNLTIQLSQSLSLYENQKLYKGKLLATKSFASIS